MRASEILGKRAVDATGAPLGTVLDARIRQVTDESSGCPTGEWEIDGIVVGPRRAFARAGYAYGGLRRPVILAAALRALGRQLRFVPWEQVNLNDGNVSCDVHFEQLRHPSEVGDA